MNQVCVTVCSSTQYRTPDYGESVLSKAAQFVCERAQAAGRTGGHAHSSSRMLLVLTGAVLTSVVLRTAWNILPCVDGGHRRVRH